MEEEAIQRRVGGRGSVRVSHTRLQCQPTELGLAFSSLPNAISTFSHPNRGSFLIVSCIDKLLRNR